jgi:HK97 family phage major capsid protein
MFENDSNNNVLSINHTGNWYLTGKGYHGKYSGARTGAIRSNNFLVPEDVRAAINELRKTYVSAKSLVTVETTDALAGSVNYEDGVPTGLTNFDDGEALAEEEGIKFVPKKFSIVHYGKIIPVSRILLGAEKGGLMSYINRFFLRNAILTENAAIFADLKAGYNGGTVKAVAGWKALKKSITKDLDPSCLLNGVIITNQSGFAALDEEEDNDGRPVLQANPANPTEKLFQGLPIHVFPDAQLPNIDATHFPMIYGDTKAGLTFVEHKALEFALSEHANFNKNQNTLRVIEGFDTMSTDTSAYIYGSFSATAQA